MTERRNRQRLREPLGTAQTTQIDCVRAFVTSLNEPVAIIALGHT